MNLYLIGYMGSGKSSVGKRMANRLDLDFIDLDAMIEDYANASVQEIFEESGEENFRSLENHMLDKVLDLSAVIATGGGTPCHSGNLQKMLDTGLVVYLRLPTAKLIKRITQGKQNRPLVLGKSEEELKEYVKEHFESRRDVYESADHIVNADKVNAALLDSIKNEYLDKVR